MTEASGSTVPDQGLFARVIGVITSPGETMKAVVANPRPAGVLFLVCLVIALTTVSMAMTQRGRQAMLEAQVQQTERFTGQPVNDEQYQRMEQFSHYQGIVAGVSIFIVLPVMSLLFAAVYWAVFNTIMGGTASFKQVLGIVTHSQVIGALGALAGAPIQYAKGVFTNTGPFNLGALVPMLEPDSVVVLALSSIGIFTVWSLMVNGIGLGVLYKKKSFGISLTLVLLYVVIAAGVGIAFSGMGR
jgi:hypothetical protein